MKLENYIGMVMGIIAIVLGWIWFGWQLPIVLCLAIAGNNLERSGRNY